VRETSFAILRDPHSGQVRGGGSEIFCITSLIRPQPSHRYS
jgi:hypothetical protein